jgi:hypothetical protein
LAGGIARTCGGTVSICMAILTLDASRDGLGNFPADFEPVARDDIGDVLAVDSLGVVWCFEHDMGAWQSRSKAFASLAVMHEYMAGQADFDLVDAEESLAALQDRKARVEASRKRLHGSPYVRDAAILVLADLREAIADRRFWQSKRGQNLAARQAIAMRCEQVLNEAGVPGDWMVRAQGADTNLIGVRGPFAAPWSEARVLELLQPLLESRFELRCFVVPPK